MNLTIGSGDVHSLMQKKETKGFQDLLRKFVDENKPYYNALASPIDALRTGALLEQRYLETLGDDYFIQYKVTNEGMNVFTSSLDFAKIDHGTLVDFDELKTLHLTEYISIIQPLAEMPEELYILTIKKKFKAYYYQVQIQLFCSNLNSCNLVFLSVTSYDDDENMFREINPNDFHKFRISRDESVINEIKEKAEIFQTIKNYFI
jgi:hypothetical protein